MSAPTQADLEVLFNKTKPDADKLAAEYKKKAPKEDDPFMGSEELMAAKMMLTIGAYFIVWVRHAQKTPKDKKHPWMLWVGKCIHAVVPKTRRQKEKYPWVQFKVCGDGEVPSTEELPFPMDGFYDEGQMVLNYSGFVCPSVRDASPEPKPPTPVNASRAPSLKQAAEMPDDDDDIHPPVGTPIPPRTQSESPSSINVCSMEYGLDLNTGWLEFIQGEPAVNEMKYNSWSIWLDRNFGGFGEKLTTDPKDVQAIDFARKSVQDAAKLYMVSEGGAASYEKEWNAKVNENINILITWYRVKHYGLLPSVARHSIKGYKTDPFPEKFEQHHEKQMIEIRTRQLIEGGTPTLTRVDRKKHRLGQPLGPIHDGDPLNPTPDKSPPAPIQSKKTPPPTNPQKGGATPPTPPPKNGAKGKQQSSN